MQAPTLQKIHFPAPTGGINSVDPASELPDTDAVYIYNMVRAQLGLRSRTGYQEWAIGLQGGADNTVRTMLPYSGSAQNQTNDKLFATTAKGIWDVTLKSVVAWQILTIYVVGQQVSNVGNVYVCTIGGTSLGGPTGTGNGIVDGTVTWNFVGPATTQVVVFPVTTDPSGYGQSTVLSVPGGGRFMVYVDEVNGPYVYSEASKTWTAIPSGVTALWQTNLFVVVGTRVQNGGNTYVATTGGTTNGSGSGPTGIGPGITDGSTVVWTGSAGAPAAGTAIGPSVADQNNGLYLGVNGGGLAAAFASVVVWKSRLFFVEKGSTRAWFMPIGAVYGTATAQDFGFKMLKGGPLVNLYNWSFDGGSGPDARLVAISSAGDIEVWQGTDPNSASTFGIVGTWNVGGVPYGRRIAVEYGGDVLVASMLGLIPLSKLIIGNPVLDRTVYDTYKISNIFNQLAVTFQTQLGWAIVPHPTDNCILVNVPQPLGWSPLQFAMAFSTRAWSTYRDLPIVSAATWNGLLYIGTADGRVCVCQGPVDNVTITNPSANQKPIQWSVLTCFKGADRPTKKIPRQIRPSLLSAVPNPVIQAVAKLDFDTTEPVDTSSSGVGGAGTWDHGIWDKSLWGSDLTPANPTIGAWGMAQVAVAIAIRGQALSYTTLVGADCFFEDASLV
jgi:hypothetical protein